MTVIFLSSAPWPSPASAADGAAQAVCEDEVWVSGPELREGVFEGTLEVRCRITGAVQSTVEGLRATIENRIRRKKKIASETAGVGEEGLPAEIFDATTVLNEGEGSSEVSLRDEIRVGSNERDRLIYGTESREIRARGMGRHLKSVAFRADLGSVPGTAGTFALTMRNRIAIERPWYAAPVFFMPIAKRVCVEKFRRAREVLLSLILERLSGREPGSGA